MQKIESSIRDGEKSDMYVSFMKGGHILISVDGCCGGGCMVDNIFDESELMEAIRKAKGLEGD